MSVFRKYLILTPYFPTENNHVGSYIYDQAKAVEKLSKFDVEVIKLVGPFSKEEDYFLDGLKVHIFKVIDIPFFILPGFFNTLNSNRICSFISERFLSIDLAIVHAHVCYPSVFLANALSSRYDIKTIIQHHGIDALQLLNGRFPIITKIQNSILRRVFIKQLNNIDLNVSVSKLVEKKLHSYEEYSPISEYVLYNGVDKEKFYPFKEKPSETYSIGCVANFWPIKDHINLIKAVESIIADGVEDISLRLIGKGETLEKCVNYVRKNNLGRYVSFEKERAHTKLNQFYNELNLLVLPSYYEALGCVLLEAWATNTPVISIDNQGFSEILPENELENLLASKQDSQSLKEKIMGEYEKKRVLVFDERYYITNTISEFLKQPIFNL